MKVDALTILKLVVATIVAIFVIILVILKFIPPSSAASVFTGTVIALLGALGVSAAGQHIGAGLAASASSPTMTLEQTADDVKAPLPEIKS